MLFAKFRLKRWLKKGQHRLFDYDIPLIALSFDLSEFEVYRCLRQCGYWSERYTDDLCSVRYYINSTELMLEPLDFASSYADENGTVQIIGCRFE